MRSDSGRPESVCTVTSIAYNFKTVWLAISRTVGTLLEDE